MEFLIYQINIDVLEKKIKTNIKKGLNSEQVKKNILKYGLNKIKKVKKISLFKLFLKQFNDFFVYILLISSFFTLYIGISNQEKKEIFESILIFTIVFGNSFLGCFYEKQKENAIKIIKKNTQLYAKVLRNNKLKLILREEIVPGDIIFLEQGDIVPADSRIIESNNFRIDESILTGENLPIEKNHNLNKIFDKNLLKLQNAVFMDTNVVSGYAKAVVIKTGSYTEIGKITQMILKTKKIKTPLEKNINDLTKIIGLMILFLIIINFSLNLIKFNLFQKKIDIFLLKKMILSSIILAVAVIPEGLLAIITIILTLSIKKIAKKKAIIKNLKALETLGAINIICTDKTGTLTKNKMQIQKIYLYKEKFEVKKNLISKQKENQYLIKLIYYGILCENDFFYIKNKKKHKKIDPIDKSFIELANLYDLNIDLIKKENNKIKEIPFNNQYKCTINIYKQKDEFLFTIKGACEILLKLSKYIENKNNIFLKNKFNQNEIENDLNFMSQKGFKVLTISYAKLKNLSLDLKENISIIEILKLIKNNIIFLGSVAIKDPIRKEIANTIINCQKAFITPVMITGDHLNTAQNVAIKTGILKCKKDLLILGSELDNLKEEELIKKIPNIKVYARVNPEHKFRIIQTYQKMGYIVAMIGDGVNDAPSIKMANVGIAMGITGTEITKQAADIILLDDNFITLQKAIREGRNIFNNIKKSILFLLSCNIGEIFVILLNTCLNHLFFTFDFSIINSLQILWINLVTDSLVAIPLGFEPKEMDLMKQKPRKIKKSLLNKKLIFIIILEGILIGFLTFLSSIIGYKKYNNIQNAQTFAFMVLSLSQLFHVFNFRNIQNSIFSLKKQNIFLNLFFVISVFLQFSIFFIPFLKKYFQLSNLNLIDIIFIILLSMMPLIIIEIFKFFIKIKKIKKFE
ncbi:cation-translocating P-type ATPase [Candidatus Phytoplasma oryzae]|nr:cation-translocating P-type ATPase [Candidatus Phytoplasma oryzae]